MPHRRARTALAIAVASLCAAAPLAHAGTLAVGWWHSLLTLAGSGPNGTLIRYTAGCGANGNGEIGTGGTADQPTANYTWVDDPSGLRLLSQPSALAAGYAHSLAVENGALYAWGDNQWGQLGTGTPGDALYAKRIHLPTYVPSPRKPVLVEYQPAAIAAGDFHTLVVTNAGGVLSWGKNDHCQLGSIALCIGGTGTSYGTPLFVVDGGGARLAGASAVAAGQQHSLALLAGGTVVGWGSNQFNELGNPAIAGATNVPTAVPGLANVVAIAAYRNRSMALKADGTVWQWGQDGYVLNGITAVPAPIAATPVQVPGLTGVVAIGAGFAHATALRADGSVWEWTFTGSPHQVAGLPPVGQIADGGGRRLARATGGALYAWGDNQRGALCTGESAVTYHAAPVQLLPF